MTVPAARTDPLSGAALYADVIRYAGFGSHRYGSPGERAATEWIANELRAAGLDVADQPLTMPRQFVPEHAGVQLGGQSLEAFPHWWPPEAGLPLDVSAPLKQGSHAGGALAWVALTHDRASYLNDEHRRRILEAAVSRPAAVLLTIDNPADEIFTYNVDQATEPWPVPVVVVAARHAARLEAAQRNGEPVRVTVRGHYERDVPGRNVIGRLARQSARTIVVSTPVSSWFVSACERGPGIANFLALARHVGAGRLDADFVFVATVGHEIGHGGMERFIAHAAPAPAATTAWVHLGASNACYGGQRPDTAGHDGGVDAESRVLAFSPSLQPVVQDAFAEIAAHRFTGERAGVGELREVRAAGYPDFFGMAGMHRYFHTPQDSPALTGPEILEPVARAFARALERLASPMHRPLMHGQPPHS